MPFGNGGLLAEHSPEVEELAGVRSRTGSLGHGLPIATGKRKKNALGILPQKDVYFGKPCSTTLVNR